MIHIVRMDSRREGDSLTHHTNTSTKGVWWEVAPEFSLHNTGVSVRAGDATEIHISESAREVWRYKGKYVPPDNSDF